MGRGRMASVKSFVSLAAVAAISLAVAVVSLAVAAPAQADVGFESVSRHAGAPGDRVDLTIGCGFCLPPCVGRPGHRHPPGERQGVCMLGPHKDPPAFFPVWLARLDHSLDRYMCDLGEGCRLGARPPRLPSFVYLGRAEQPWPQSELDDRRRVDVPRYRLIFGVPEVPPGAYKYVLFCHTCVDGPRGSLIDNATVASGRLRVLPPVATASGDFVGGRAKPWLGVGLAAAVLAVAFAALRRGRAPRPRAGRAG
jgi:hypothetical protein